MRAYLESEKKNIHTGNFRADSRLSKEARAVFLKQRSCQDKAVLNRTTHWFWSWFSKSKELLHDQAARFLRIEEDEVACLFISKGANFLAPISSLENQEESKYSLFTLAIFKTRRVALCYMALLFKDEACRAKWASHGLLYVQDIETARLLINMGANPAAYPNLLKGHYSSELIAFLIRKGAQPLPVSTNVVR